MSNKDISDLIFQIEENIEIILRRTASLESFEGFTLSDSGMILLDGVCMKLVVIGESIKNLDRVTDRKCLCNYPSINWKQSMGMRDIIVHHYFNVDAEVIFNTLKEDLPMLLSVLKEIRENMS